MNQAVGVMFFGHIVHHKGRTRAPSRFDRADAEPSGIEMTRGQKR